MMVRIDQNLLDQGFPRLALGHRLADDEDATGRVLEDIGDGQADGEVAAEADLVGQAQDDGVRAQGDGLVHEGGPDVASLQELRVQPDLGPLGETLGQVERPRGGLALDLKVVVEVVAPVHLDDVDGHQLGPIGTGQLAAELDDIAVDGAPVEMQDGALDRVGLGSRWTRRKPNTAAPPMAAGRLGSVRRRRC